MNNLKYTELEKKYLATEDPIKKIDLYVALTLEVRNEDPEKGLIMAEKIIVDAREANYPIGIGEGLNHKGACYWLLSEYEEGLSNLAEAYQIAITENCSRLEAKVLNNLGRIYRDLGDLSHALRNFEEALRINERQGHKINQSINLTNISNLYYDLGDYDTALEYAQKCLPIFERYDDPNKLFTVYFILGDIYFKKGIFHKCLGYYKDCLSITSEGSLNRSFTYSGLGKVYYKLGHFEKSLNYLEKGLDLAQELNSPEAVIIAKFYLGKVRFKQGHKEKAIELAEGAYKTAKEFKRKQDLISIHEFLSILFEETGNVSRAYQHLKAYERTREAIFQQATLDKLRNLQVRTEMEVAKKEKEIAEKTARLKQQFMANMSHEIRTPMNAIIGLTHLLLQKDPKPDQIKYLTAIRQSSDNLLVLINDILDISKIEEGKIQLEHIPFSIRELLKNLKETMTVKADEKSLYFDVIIPEDLPDTFEGAPTRINQILINLAGNAIKFTEKGHVKIILSQSPLTEGKIILKMAVEDTGIGISKEYVETIFKSFTQAGTDIARKYGGTGLGLTISKQLVNLMQGEITVESVVDEGTTFTVSIPLPVVKEPIDTKAEKVDTKELEEQLKNLSILLVEDNEFNQMVAVDTLKNLLPDIKVTTKENGREAIYALAQEDFDLIFMDIQMPIMNGLEATHYIRNKMAPPKNKSKIIAMTANVLSEDVKHYLDSGMNGYLSKPFKQEELLQKMYAVLHPHKIATSAERNTQNEGENQIINQLNLPEKITTMDFLNQFTGGDISKKKKYIGMFLDNGGKLMKQIEAAWAERDYEQIKVASHSMKPQLAYMGVPEEVSNILLIEKSAGASTHLDRLPVWIKHLRKVFNQATKELKDFL